MLSQAQGLGFGVGLWAGAFALEIRVQCTETPKACKIIALNHNNSNRGHYFRYFWGPGRVSWSRV